MFVRIEKMSLSAGRLKLGKREAKAHGECRVVHTNTATVVPSPATRTGRRASSSGILPPLLRHLPRRYNRT